MVLRITPCSMQPESDRHTPTSPPASTRGKRRFHTIRRAMLPSSINSALATSEAENLTLPMPVHISTDKKDIMPNRVITIQREAFLRTASFPGAAGISERTVLLMPF